MRQTLHSLQNREDALTSTSKAIMHFKDQYSRGAYSILAKTNSKTQYIIEKTKRAFNTMDNEELSNEANSDSDNFLIIIWHPTITILLYPLVYFS